MTDRFRTILVPHDLSRHSTRALAMAARLAGARGRVIVLHVVNPYGNGAVQERVVHEARRALERVVRRTMASRPGPRHLHRGLHRPHAGAAARNRGGRNPPPT